ncbi:hypothetical protein J1605_004638 [Eschrichtius robustus]|uniref:Uncharacterized protein n=1 Tax=Eschrichtius robustus TaxID=9764 RepID=A0AB34HEL0_ESCRO|nr:hypothetical protein J1605_004638 [Eschrichtius robustus]
MVRGPRTAMKNGPRLPQLEKALAQKGRPNTAITRLLCTKKDSTKKGNAKGAQSHGLRACPIRDQSQDLPRSWDAFLSCLGWSLGPKVTEEEAFVSRLGTSDSGVGAEDALSASFPGLKGETLERML